MCTCLRRKLRSGWSLYPSFYSFKFTFKYVWLTRFFRTPALEFSGDGKVWLILDVYFIWNLGDCAAFDSTKLFTDFSRNIESGFGPRWTDHVELCEIILIHITTNLGCHYLLKKIQGCRLVALLATM